MSLRKHSIPLLANNEPNTPLDRDSARLKLKPAEIERRRAVFWELFTTGVVAGSYLPLFVRGPRQFIHFLLELE